MTYYGIDYAKRTFFAYILCTPDTAKQMYRDHAEKKPKNISDYGTIIYTDFISEPDEKAKAFLKHYLADNH